MVIAASARRNPVDSGVVTAGVISGWNHENFVAGFDNFLALLLIGCAAVPSFWLLDRLLLKDAAAAAAPPRETMNQTLRKTAAFLAAALTASALGWRYGAWIPLTVALSYSTGASGRSAASIALARFALAPAGMLAAMLYLDSAGRGGAIFSYAAVLWGVAGYYFSYRTGRFGAFYLPFLVMLCCAKNLAHGPGTPFGNSWDLGAQAVSAIGIGALLVIVAELPSGGKAAP